MAWPRGFSSRLRKARDENIFTDIDIQVDGRVFSAHRTLLVSSSDYFLHMLTGGMKEAAQSTISIGGVSAETFECVLHFIYALCCPSSLRDFVSLENVGELMCAADMFQVDDLKDALALHIADNMDDHNTLDVYVLGWKYNIPLLCSKASNLMAANMKQIMTDDHFGLMDVDCAKCLFSSACFTTKYEDDYCRAALTWFYFDRDNREEYFSDVMSFFCHHKIKVSLTDSACLQIFHQFFIDIIQKSQQFIYYNVLQFFIKSYCRRCSIFILFWVIVAKRLLLLLH